MLLRTSRRALFALPFLLACASEPRDVDSDAPPLRVMTFNVRYGTADDGENRWENRREFALDVVEEFAPHVLAVQEALDFQLAELVARMPRLRVIGQHREGGAKGEFSGLLVDETRVEVEEWGELWLSPTPNVVASKGWDAALPRMAVWARVRDRESSRELVAIGTHFDHRGERARLESAKLLAREAHERWGEIPVVLMGDFNAGEASPPCVALREAGFVDTFRVAHPDATEVGTFSAFRGVTNGEKIDYVFARGDLRVLSAEILRPRRSRRCPSDHDPVVATLR